MIQSHLEYLINDVIFNNLDINNRSDIDYDIINNNIFIFKNKQIVYSEPVFSFSSCKLELLEILYLEEILLNSNKNELLINDQFPILKAIYFFINEIYLDLNIKDKHDRVTSDSVKFEFKKLLEFPITDILIKEFLNKIGVILENSFSFNLTCDYDIINYWGGLNYNSKFKFFIKLVLQLKIIDFFIHFFSLILSKHLNFFNFYINDKMFLLKKTKINNKVKINNYAFLLLNCTNNEYDFRNKFTKSILNYFEKIKKKGVILGLHPSYDSSKNHELIKNQSNYFFKLFKLESKHVRYHYLRVNYDFDLEILEDNNFSHDFTCGFADSLLFRAGTTKQFKRWNAKTDKKYNIDIIPISIMDSTLFDYLNCKGNSCLDLAKKKLEVSYDYGFQITTLIHNNNLSRFTSKGEISKKINKMILDFVLNKLFEKK